MALRSKLGSSSALRRCLTPGTNVRLPWVPVSAPSRSDPTRPADGPLAQSVPCPATAPQLAPPGFLNASTLDRETRPRAETAVQSVDTRCHSTSAAASASETAARATVAGFLARRSAPPTQALHRMLEECASLEELDVALRLLARTRLDNASVRRQFANFREHVTDSAVAACLRAGDVERALLLLHPRNPYGLSFSARAALDILHHAKEHGPASAALSALRRMEEAQGGAPSPNTADLVVRGLLAGSSEARAVHIAEQFLSNDVALRVPTVDALLRAVVEKALVGEAAAVLRIRERVLAGAKGSSEEASGLSPDAAVPLAMAHLLNGDVSSAVDTVSAATESEMSIGEGVLESSLLSALKGLLRVAPSALPAAAADEDAAQEQGQDHVAGLKEAVGSFLEEARNLPNLANVLPSDVASLLESEDASGPS